MNILGTAVHDHAASPRFYDDHGKIMTKRTRDEIRHDLGKQAYHGFDHQVAPAQGFCCKMTQFC